MEIATKFGINQEIYFIENNKLKRGTIKSIRIEIDYLKKTLVFYTTDKQVCLLEDNFYSSPKEYADSVLKEFEPFESIENLPF